MGRTREENCGHEKWIFSYRSKMKQRAILDLLAIENAIKLID